MKKWKFSAGTRPNTVTVYERQSGGVLYARAWKAGKGKGEGSFVRISLGHRDKGRAKRYATAQAAKLQEGVGRMVDDKVDLGSVFAVYLEHRSPRKAPAQRKADERRMEMFARVFGSRTDPHKISLSMWEAFTDDRASGAIDARGRRVPMSKRRVVRARGVEIDCTWLKAVFNWAARWRLASGNYLMRENPLRGHEFTSPREKNPRRPVATQDRYERIRAVSDTHSFECRANGRREKRRSYISEILDIASGTGRRISAICALRFDDLQLAKTETAPSGAICWPAATDKEGYETVAPMTPVVREAVDRILKERGGLGPLPLFPAPANPSVPMSRHLADKWLREVERLAKLEPQKGGLWHPYRRKWATERKGFSDVDVAAVGGWKSLEALKQSYQHADAQTMLRVVMGEGQLREA